MTWTAIVPLKLGAESKSRLAGRLTAQQRASLSDAMAAHVLACLQASASISRCIVLAPMPLAQHVGEWRKDLGRGLNAELEAVRGDLASDRLLVVFGDLPLLSPDEIAALIAGGEKSGIALAPDWAGQGTNGVVIARLCPFRFCFGEKSLSLHLAQAPDAALVERPGLARDIDTMEDLEAAIAAGLRLGVPIF